MPRCNSKKLDSFDPLFEFEKSMLYFFRKDFDHTNIRQSFKKRLQNLSALDSNLYEQRVETYFKFINWVESKIA
jgi:hypothetical protein